MNQANDYLVWRADWRDDWCRLCALENVDKAAEIRFGLSRAQAFPADASFSMDPDFPHDTLLTDCLTNASQELVLSTRVVEFLKKAEIPQLEYLPVRVLDHRGRQVEEAYTLVHPIQPVDCLDLDACEPTWNRIVAGQIRRVRKLVLDSERVDPTRRLFRCAAFTKPKIVHRSLAEELTAAGFTGCGFVELEDYRP